MNTKLVNARRVQAISHARKLEIQAQRKQLFFVSMGMLLLAIILFSFFASNASRVDARMIDAIYAGHQISDTDDSESNPVKTLLHRTEVELKKLESLGL